MRKNTFSAEITKKDSICRVCNASIPIGAVRIKIQGYKVWELYHFKCYTPKVKQYICKNDVKIRLDSENAEIVNKWIEDWNKNYMPLDKPFHEPPQFSKLVESTPSRYRRAWLEVFKFLDAIDIFKLYSYINKEFYHISWDEELWHFYCLRDYANVTLNIHQNNYRSQYIILYMESCFWCHSRSTEGNFQRCPLIKKPLCTNCKKLERFNYMCKQDIQTQYGINPNILQLKFGEGFLSRKVVYKYMADEAVESFRKQNKEFLLGAMKKNNLDATMIEFVENIDLKSLDICSPNRIDSLKSIGELLYDYLRSKLHEKRVLSRLKSFN